MPSMSKTKFWKLAKEAKNLIFCKHVSSIFQTKWDILFTNMGLYDRHFISQPQEQRIITVWNKIKFSDFRNTKKQILQQEDFPGNSPLRWSCLGLWRSKRPHTLCWSKKFRKEGLAENHPLDPTWMVPFFTSIIPNNFISGVISLRNFCASKFFFWLFL